MAQETCFCTITFPWMSPPLDQNNSSYMPQPSCFSPSGWFHKDSFQDFLLFKHIIHRLSIDHIHRLSIDYPLLYQH